MATVEQEQLEQLEQEVGSKLEKAEEVQFGHIDNLEIVIGNSMT